MEDVIAKRERERVIESAKTYINSLKGLYSAFLIGSYAKGDFNALSDVDVLLVGDFHGNPLERLLKLDFPPGFEVIPLTEEEFNRALKKNNLIIYDARVMELC